LTQDEITLVAGLAGAAIVLTLLDLLLSLIRHRRLARVRSYSTRLDPAPQDETAAVVKSEWIRRRLSAIQNAGTADTPAPPTGSI
jgi:hypothetical protein